MRVSRRDAALLAESLCTLLRPQANTPPAGTSSMAQSFDSRGIDVLLPHATSCCSFSLVRQREAVAAQSQPSCVSAVQATSQHAWLWSSCAPDLRSWHCQEQVQGWHRLWLVPLGAGELHTALSHCMDLCCTHLPVQHTNPDSVLRLQFEDL